MARYKIGTSNLLAVDGYTRGLRKADNEFRSLVLKRNVLSGTIK